MRKRTSRHPLLVDLLDLYDGVLTDPSLKAEIEAHLPLCRKCQLYWLRFSGDGSEEDEEDLNTNA